LPTSSGTTPQKIWIITNRAVRHSNLTKCLILRISSIVFSSIKTCSEKGYTGCPTRYRIRHFFNNSNTSEDIATEFEQEYVRYVRNEEKCVCNVCLFCCNNFIGVRII
jgi:hypothetical protein